MFVRFILVFDSGSKSDHDGAAWRASEQNRRCSTYHKNTERVWEHSFISGSGLKKFREIFFLSLFFRLELAVLLDFLVPDSDGPLDWVEHQVLELEPVFRGRLLVLRQEPELPDQVAAVGQVFRGDEIDADRNAALKIFHLKKWHKVLSRSIFWRNQEGPWSCK